MSEHQTSGPGEMARQAPQGKLPLLGLSALGIVFGDIGTSPLYTFKTILSTAGKAPEANVVLGGAVKGGRMAGEQVKVEHASLFQNRDYPVLTDYRALFGGLFARAYGLDQKLMAQVFPGVTAKDLALV